MLATTHSFSRMGLLPKREDFRPREDSKSRNVSSKKADTRNFSLCESMKITIMQGRIAYISTYNTEIFNGSQIITEVEDRVRVERKQDNGKKQVTETYVQTV